MTVRGPVDPSLIGFTLPHEHFHIQLWAVAGRFEYPHQLEDDDLFAAEIAAFQAQGGSAVVDLTPPDIGRRPERLRALAERTGAHLVMGCGWYRGPYYRPEEGIERRPSWALADELEHEISEGAAATGIRPGVVGEIGVDRAWMTPAEERVHRAAGRAAARTGLPLATHSVLGEIGLDQLRVFEAEGLDPARVAIGHADTHPFLDYYLRVISRGALLLFDGLIGPPFRTPYDESRILGLIVELVDRGHADRLMLSHDFSISEQLTARGGTGLAYVGGTIVPRLRALGVPDDVIEQITAGNPRRWLTIAGSLTTPG